MTNQAPVASFVVCPESKSNLEPRGATLFSAESGRTYEKPGGRYYNFVLDPNLNQIDTTSTHYACDQGSHWPRFYGEWLKPCLERQPFESVLEVGCGLGYGVAQFLDDGYYAYGVDTPSLFRFWEEIGHDPAHFFGGDGCQLPFADNSFDVVYSLGVIEHIGTAVGHYTLTPAFQAARQAYANEAVRVTKPGGRILIACPNKGCPIDIQHDARDDAMAPGERALAQWIFERTGMTLHKTWGKYHLLNYGETETLFRNAGATGFEPLPLKGYFGFGRFKQGFLKPFRPFIEGWVNHIPKPILRSGLNPYMLALMTK